MKFRLVEEIRSKMLTFALPVISFKYFHTHTPFPEHSSTDNPLCQTKQLYKTKIPE